jgi:hypothetical protein
MARLSRNTSALTLTADAMTSLLQLPSTSGPGAATQRA